MLKCFIKYLEIIFLKTLSFNLLDKSLKYLKLKFGFYNCLQILTILHFVCRPMVYIVISQDYLIYFVAKGKYK